MELRSRLRQGWLLLKRSSTREISALNLKNEHFCWQILGFPKVVVRARPEFGNPSKRCLSMPVKGTSDWDIHVHFQTPSCCSDRPMPWSRVSLQEFEPCRTRSQGGCPLIWKPRINHFRRFLFAPAFQDQLRQLYQSAHNSIS